MKNAEYLWGLPLRVPGTVSFSFFVFHFTMAGYLWGLPLRVPGIVSFSFFVFHFTITLCTEPSFSVITYAPRLIGIDVSPSGRSTRFTS